MNSEIGYKFYETIIIGSGCAAYNSADWLYALGHKNIAILTEGKNVGVSRNTGSDKQTYYKLSLCSDGADSVREMADTLYAGGCVDGDIALCEAANSVKCFMKLVNIGVPFPTNKYGEYVGYKTDHDPRQRATSVGPLTSKYMTEALENEVVNKNITIIDGMYVTKILVKDNTVIGLVAIDLNDQSQNFGVKAFECENIILATGGPAGIYFDSVYPTCHTGSSGLALEAGAEMCNLQEWQYGLASTAFRWNVSGTYQQVIPRYISIDKYGNEREFLLDYFDNIYDAYNNVFLKGYQWPFDAVKIKGSSQIDMIVHNEIYAKGNRVFMDFTRDPYGLTKETLDKLPKESYEYLKKSNAIVDLPIERLKIMNSQAIDLYLKNGIDITCEPLEVSVCAQHNNGGIAVDSDWQSTVKGLYAAGEAAGTFGVYRPGGSALNSTQVGSMRASEAIAFSKQKHVRMVNFSACARQYVDELTHAISISKGESSNITKNRIYMQKKMSKLAAHMRDIEKIKEYIEELKKLKKDFFALVTYKYESEIVHLLKNRDIVLVQLAVCEAMSESAKTAGSRGSCLVYNEQKDGFLSENTSYREQILRINMKNDQIESRYVKRREIPKNDDWFENVWKEFNKKIGIE